MESSTVVARRGWNVVYRNKELDDKFFVRIERRPVYAADYGGGGVVGIMWEKEK